MTDPIARTFWTAATAYIGAGKPTDVLTHASSRCSHAADSSAVEFASDAENRRWLDNEKRRSTMSDCLQCKGCGGNEFALGPCPRCNGFGIEPSAAPVPIKFSEYEAFNEAERQIDNQAKEFRAMMAPKSPAPIDSAKVEDTGEREAFEATGLDLCASPEGNFGVWKLACAWQREQITSPAGINAELLELVKLANNGVHGTHTVAWQKRAKAVLAVGENS